MALFGGGGSSAGGGKKGGSGKGRQSAKGRRAAYVFKQRGKTYEYSSDGLPMY